MLNQVVLVGRIKELNEHGIKLSCQRAFKNESGEYETDIITVFYNGLVASGTLEYCKPGDIVGIKGRLVEDSGTHAVKVLAEKVTFLSSRSTNE